MEQELGRTKFSNDNLVEWNLINVANRKHKVEKTEIGRNKVFDKWNFWNMFLSSLVWKNSYSLQHCKFLKRNQRQECVEWKKYAFHLQACQQEYSNLQYYWFLSIVHRITLRHWIDLQQNYSLTVSSRKTIFIKNSTYMKSNEVFGKRVWVEKKTLSYLQSRLCTHTTSYPIKNTDKFYYI